MAVWQSSSNMVATWRSARFSETASTSVGRGAWAGPVTYCAVVLPSDRRMYKLRDSKQLDPARREALADLQSLCAFYKVLGTYPLGE